METTLLWLPAMGCLLPAESPAATQEPEQQPLPALRIPSGRCDRGLSTGCQDLTLRLCGLIMKIQGGLEVPHLSPQPKTVFG